MKNLIKSTLCVALISITIACNQSRPATNSAEPASKTPGNTAPATADMLSTARINFNRNCLGCHGERGEGGRVEANGKTLEVPSLKVGHALSHSDEDFVEQINEGGDGMPPFKDKLTPEEVAELVRFVRREFQGR